MHSVATGGFPGLGDQAENKRDRRRWEMRLQCATQETRGRRPALGDVVATLQRMVQRHNENTANAVHRMVLSHHVVDKAMLYTRLPSEHKSRALSGGSVFVLFASSISTEKCVVLHGSSLTQVRQRMEAGDFDMTQQPALTDQNLRPWIVFGYMQAHTQPDGVGSLCQDSFSDANMREQLVVDWLAHRQSCMDSGDVGTGFKQLDMMVQLWKETEWSLDEITVHATQVLRVRQQLPIDEGVFDPDWDIDMDGIGGEHDTGHDPMDTDTDEAPRSPHARPAAQHKRESSQFINHGMCGHTWQLWTSLLCVHAPCVFMLSLSNV
jgi:hypothetical protein